MPSGRQPIGGSIFWMLIAAALFGYLGFGWSWAHEWTRDGERVWMVTLLMWTLRTCSVGFLLSAILIRLQPFVSAALYGGLGMIASIVFVVVAVWDYRTPDLFSGIPPFLLVIFAVINGAASWQELRVLMVISQTSPGEGTSALK